jgi:F-type H+-transporting ATPase subunit gamma
LCFNSNVIKESKKRAEFYTGVQVDIFAIGKKETTLKTNSVVDDQK